MIEKTEQGLVAELVELVRTRLAHEDCVVTPAAACLHRWAADDVDADACEESRALLTRATPEAVRKADAAPALYEALDDVLELAEKWADGVGQSHPDHERTAAAHAALDRAGRCAIGRSPLPLTEGEYRQLAEEQEDAAIAKAEGQA